MGLRRAAMRSLRRAATVGPTLVRSAARPGQHVGTGRANRTAMAFSPTTLRTKLRNLAYVSRSVVCTVMELMRPMVMRRRISTPSTAAYARLNRILPWMYEMGSMVITARQACSTRPWQMSTSRSMASEKCRRLSAMGRMRKGGASLMREALHTTMDTRKNPLQKKMTRLEKSPESMESMKRCAHSMWWNTTTASFTATP
mmetsp:Transcript_16965/g.41688  ORF Transcript_16965/g.41688 Transcript_16965/m.41688 type:complete len:200 (-) Transcript_16965:1043-1642(-)